MNIHIYSDESGVFDQVHNDYFVFGGILFLSKEERDICSRMYKKAENDIRHSRKYDFEQELKASFVSNKDKGKLYRSLNRFYKFGVIVDQKKVYQYIFKNKKTKQRFLDYAYKIAVKNCLLRLMGKGVIDKTEHTNMYFYMDEHTTATDGRYELRESLEEEFKIGTMNFEYNIFHNPIFDNLHTLALTFYDSKDNTLIRAADIVANKIYHKAITNSSLELELRDDLFIKYLP